MRKLFVFALLLFAGHIAAAQQKKSYADSLKAFQLNYVSTHEIVKEADRKYFSFFPVDVLYNVTAEVTAVNDTAGFQMATSAGTKKQYFKYALLRFKLKGKNFQLYLYRSKDLMQVPQYKNYLFLPFADLTSAVTTYGAGRYIDVETTDIKNGKLIIDFNKAYNPYCAYATGFQCPLPPQECNLDIAIEAGEKTFGKSVH